MSRLSVHGHIKIYLGYAPGVGKTHQMLEDARDLKSRGIYVVVGFAGTHGRSDIQGLLDGFEIIRLKQTVHRGGTTDELDVDAILRRRPRVCVVDELARSTHRAPRGQSAGRMYRR